MKRWKVVPGHRFGWTVIGPGVNRFGWQLAFSYVDAQALTSKWNRNSERKND